MTPILFILITNLLAYFMLFVLCSVSTLNNSNSLDKVLSGKGSIVQLNVKHFISTLIVIILFSWHWSFDQTLIEPFKTIDGRYTWILPSLAILVLVISLTSKLGSASSEFHRISSNQVVTYITLRFIYLIFYEIYFRLVLLNFLLNAYNTPVALLVSTFLYFIIHLFNRKREFLLSLPFGLLLGWITIATSSIYPAIILHILLSIPYELRILYHSGKQAYGKDLFNRGHRIHG